MKNRIVRLLCGTVATVFCMLCFSVGVCAENDADYYTINGDEIIPTPATYEYAGSVDRISGTAEKDFLSQPSDIFIDKDNYLYIADTGNNRIVKLDRHGNLLLSISEADGMTLNAPEGVFVTENGDVFIADTANGRVVHTDKNGQFIKSLTKPDSTLLADVNVYSPTKIAVSSKDIVYILMGEKIMSVNMSNEFLGYIGQTDIGYNFLDAFLRFFASEEQKKNIEKRNATEYTNITVNSKDLIYSVSRDTTEGQIKILNSVGTNIYRKISAAVLESKIIEDIVGNIFSGNIIEKKFIYGENVKGKAALFVDCCVNSKGIITAIQKQNGKLYQYDQEGDLLSVFGGLGQRQGEFSIPSSIAIDSEGEIYVLDASNGNVQIFEPSFFIKEVHSAVTDYYNGNYDDSYSHWQNVLELDENYPLARFGIANYENKNENYIAAMEGYRYTNDREDYSSAFIEQRYLVIRNNFPLVCLCVVLAFVLAFVGIVLLHKKSSRLLYAYEMYEVDSFGLKEGLWLCTGILMHPFRTLDNIKNSRKRIAPWGAVIIVAVVFAVRLIFIYTVHYPFMDIELEDVNIVLEFIKLIVPIITWSCAVFLISGQFSGESTLKENFIATAYCWVPYIVANLLATALSHVLGRGETGFFAFLVNGVMIWIIILLINSVSRLNDFSFGRTLLVCLVSLLCMVICWFIVLFGYMVIVSFLQFVRELMQELQLLMI